MSKWNQILEDAIMGKLIQELLDNNFRLEVNAVDSGDGQVWVYAWPEDEDKPEQFNYWVRLRPGNGDALIVDYTTNLEQKIAQTNLFAASFED